MNKVKNRFHDIVEGRERCHGAGEPDHGEAGLSRLTGRRLHAWWGGWGHRHWLGSTLALLCSLSKCLGLAGASCLWYTILSAWNSFPAESWPCERLCIPREPTQYLFFWWEHRPLQDAPWQNCLLSRLTLTVPSCSHVFLVHVLHSSWVFASLVLERTGVPSYLLPPLTTVIIRRWTAGWPPRHVDSHPQPHCPCCRPGGLSSAS